MSEIPTANSTAAKPTYLTSHAAARLASVSPSTVLSWINRGLLPAHRTPGGHRRIERQALVRFLREHAMPVPADLATIHRLLVMDSDATVLRSVRRLLRRAAPELVVETAEGAIDGLLRIGSFRPDVLLLDATMPGVSAIEICRHVRYNPGTSHTLIIAIAHHPTPKARAAFSEAGANEFLVKPLDAAALLRALRLDTGYSAQNEAW